jgi:hypothetical protein
MTYLIWLAILILQLGAILWVYLDCVGTDNFGAGMLLLLLGGVFLLVDAIGLIFWLVHIFRRVS